MHLKTGMCEYLFLYNIANGKNRTSDNEEDNGEGEDSEGHNGEGEGGEDGTSDDSGMPYSCNIIILN
jgi:hypothetical protein